MTIVEITVLSIGAIIILAALIWFYLDKKELDAIEEAYWKALDEEDKELYHYSQKDLDNIESIYQKRIEAEDKELAYNNHEHDR